MAEKYFIDTVDGPVEFFSAGTILVSDGNGGHDKKKTFSRYEPKKNLLSCGCCGDHGSVMVTHSRPSPQGGLD